MLWSLKKGSLTEGWKSEKDGEIRESFKEEGYIWTKSWRMNEFTRQRWRKLSFNIEAKTFSNLGSIRNCDLLMMLKVQKSNKAGTGRRGRRQSQLHLKDKDHAVILGLTASPIRAFITPYYDYRLADVQFCIDSTNISP